MLLFLFSNKTLLLNILKTRTVMNAKVSVFVICVKAIIYLLMYNSYGCSFKFFSITRSSCPEVFLEKVVPKICSEFTGEHPCRRMILISYFATLWNPTSALVFSTVNLLHIFKTPFSKNTSGLRLVYKAETSWNFRKKTLDCVICCIFIRFQISIVSLNIVWLFAFDLNRRIKQNH